MDLTFLNTILTPVSLFLSISVAKYAFQAYFNLKNPKDRPVATSLVAVGLLFSFFSILSSVIYVIALFTDSGLGHQLSGFRSLVTNLMIVFTSTLMIRIYRNKI